jgi:hypothetical protein
MGDTKCVFSAAWRKDVQGGKNSNRCGYQTQENIYISKVGNVGEKKEIGCNI